MFTTVPRKAEVADLKDIKEHLENRDASIGGLVLARSGLRDEVRHLSKVDNLRFLKDVSRQWIIIVAAISIAVWSRHCATYVLTIIVIATRQHALGILMHDGTHYRLLSSRLWNDVICDIFCALPVGILTSRYRYEHLLHHRFLNTDKDPYWPEYERDADWHWPKKPLQAFGVLVRDLLGVGGRRMGPVLHRWSPWINHFSQQLSPPPLTLGERARVYGFFGVLFVFLTVTGSWLEFFLLWLLPLSTLTIMLVRIRTIGEHLAMPNEHELNATRHTDGTRLEHLTISPFNINYHIDHHLFPSVPYYNLPELHQILLRNAHYCAHAKLNRTYLGFNNGLLGEIIRK